MRYLDKYRNPKLASFTVAEIRRCVTRPWVIMEICGAQTQALTHCGMDGLLPRQVQLVQGPARPVCVAGLEIIDKAVAIASTPGVIFVSYCDMLHVPGSAGDLLRINASGGDVRIAYSALQALAIARHNPDRQVVFFAVAFETTAPANALAVWQAKRERLTNFSMLISYAPVPPSISLLLESPRNRVQGFIVPGHVRATMDWTEYEDLVACHGVPIVVGGIEPLDQLEAILMLVRQLEAGRCELENQYVRSVTRQGNWPAQQRMLEVFEAGRSGFRLRPEYAAYDAEKLFGVETLHGPEWPDSISAQIFHGIKTTGECPPIGARCMPHRPLGATMASTEASQDTLG